LDTLLFNIASNYGVTHRL